MIAFQLLEQLQEAEGRRLIARLQVHTNPYTEQYKQVWYIQLLPDRARHQMQKLRDYLEMHRDCIEYTRPLGDDILKVFVKHTEPEILIPKQL